MFRMNALAGPPPQPPGRRSVFSVRQRGCGAPRWFVETGLIGVGRAAWCPDRARIRSLTRFGRPLAGSGSPVGEIVEADLEIAIERARRVRMPEWVVMAPHEDAFAATGTRARRQVILDMMRRLVRERIGVALTTRADLQDGEGLVRLAREIGDLLTVRVGVFALEPRLEAKWERGLAPSVRRLALARALREAGARVEVELGPIVPFANDDDKLLKDLVRSAARFGVDTIAPRWIEDAPGLDDQIEAEVSPSTARLVTGWFRQPGSSVGSATRRIIPLQVRKTRLEHIETAARALGIRVASCRCLAGGACVACLEARAVAADPQLDLFGPTGGRPYKTSA